MTNSSQILVLGTADWNQPIATNQHYMVRELARANADVTFVESLALRQPRMNVRDLTRIAERLLSATGRYQGPGKIWRPKPDGLDVVSPIVIPRHRGIAKVVNQLILSRKLRDWRSKPSPRVLWCYTPTTYGLERRADIVVYHCVDLLETVPGIDPRVIATHEASLAKSGATAIASSAAVADSLRQRGFADVQLWENVADTEVFESALTVAATRDPNRVIFAGNLTPSKIDYALLIDLARSGVDVRLAGPRAEGGDKDSKQFDELMRAGITYLGMLSLNELATEMAAASAGLIPYVINDYTRGVSPLKTYEYLAAGLPVVATELPGVHHDGEDVVVAKRPEDFLAAVRHLTRQTFDDTAIQRRVKKAQMNSWSGRGETARSLLNTLLSGSERTQR